MTVQPRPLGDGGHGLAVVVVNDSPAHWQGVAQVRRLGFDGTVHEEVALAYDLGPRAAATLPLPADLARAADPAREVLLAEVDGLRGWWWFAEDRDADLPEPDLDLEARTVPGGYEVTVTARTLVKDLALLADRVAPDARVDAMLLSLLPGESSTIGVTTGAVVPPAAFLDPLVLRSANQLV